MISCPHPPSPPFPLRGRGVSKVYFAGASPRHPCIESPTALADAAVQEPGGGLPGRSPARPALSFILLPHPPAPLPGGKGLFLYAGASPLASPRPSRKRHGLHLRCRCPAVVCPAGRRLTLPLALFLSPIPPPPFPLRGRGVSQSLFRRGPGTPALNRLRHLQTLPYRCPAMACPAGRRLTLPLALFLSPIPRPLPLRGRGVSKFISPGAPPCTESPTTLANAAVQVPGDGLPGRSPGRPALSFIGCPIPPPPSRREGGFSYARGFAPCIPGG